MAMTMQERAVFTTAERSPEAMIVPDLLAHNACSLRLRLYQGVAELRARAASARLAE
jgi:hypothetical protein